MYCTRRTTFTNGRETTLVARRLAFFLELKSSFPFPSFPSFPSFPFSPTHLSRPPDMLLVHAFSPVSGGFLAVLPDEEGWPEDYDPGDIRYENMCCMRRWRE